jgi:hypothetical protein
MVDWTEEAPKSESGLPAVNWEEWARETIDAISNGPEDRRATALLTLHKFANYLDNKYDGGYQGIAPMPLEGCKLGWGW